MQMEFSHIKNYEIFFFCSQASGDRGGSVALWDGKEGRQLGKALRGHKNFITALQWQPAHLAENGDILQIPKYV